MVSPFNAFMTYASKSKLGSQDYDVERVSSQDPMQFKKSSHDIDLDIHFSGRCNANSY